MSAGTGPDDRTSTTHNTPESQRTVDCSLLCEFKIWGRTLLTLRLPGGRIRVRSILSHTGAANAREQRLDVPRAVVVEAIQ